MSIPGDKNSMRLIGNNRFNLQTLKGNSKLKQMPFDALLMTLFRSACSYSVTHCLETEVILPGKGAVLNASLSLFLLASAHRCLEYPKM